MFPRPGSAITVRGFQPSKTCEILEPYRVGRNDLGRVDGGAGLRSSPGILRKSIIEFTETRLRTRLPSGNGSDSCIRAPSRQSYWQRGKRVQGLFTNAGVCRRNPAQNRIPKTWDDAAIASVTLPLAVADASPVQIPSKYYYGIPVRPIYKSYPVYHPTKEPPGYIDHLKQQEPVIAFDPSTLKISQRLDQGGRTGV